MINSLGSRSNSLYEAKKISFFGNEKDDDKDMANDLESPMVKSNFDESFERHDEDKDIAAFEVDCVSNELRLRAPAGSSHEGSKIDSDELRKSGSIKDDEEQPDNKSHDDISIDDVSDFSGEQFDERITDKSNEEFDQNNIEQTDANFTVNEDINRSQDGPIQENVDNYGKDKETDNQKLNDATEISKLIASHT